MPCPLRAKSLTASPGLARRSLRLLLCATLVAGGHVAQAQDDMAGALRRRSMASDESGLAHLADAYLADERLAEIRGRYVDAQAFDDSAGNFVILWDERPARDTGGKGPGTGTSRSIGLGNQQRTHVTSQREQ